MTSPFAVQLRLISSGIMPGQAGVPPLWFQPIWGVEAWSGHYGNFSAIIASNSNSFCNFAAQMIA